MSVGVSEPEHLDGPPGPGQSNWDLVRSGVAQLFGRGMAAHDFIADMAGRYGDLVSARDPERVFFASDPGLVRRVLVTDGRITHKGRGAEYLRALLGNGLIAAEGPEHLRNRRVVAPAFGKEQVHRYAEVMIRLAVELDEDWSRRCAAGSIEVDMAEEMSRFTLRIVGLTLYGADLEERSADIGKALADALHSLDYSRSPAAPFLLRGPTPPAYRLRRAVRQIHRVVDELVAEHQAHPDRFAGDVLTALLEARDENGAALSVEQVRDEVTTLLLAGHETTALLLSWAWYHLDANPDVAALLHAEIDRLPGPPSPTDGFPPALPATRAVVAETLRCNPPAWAVGRRYTEDACLAEYQVPAHTEVVVSQWVVHRDSRWWGQDADQFRPRRWLAEPTAGAPVCPFDERAPGHPREAFFPFGGGRRVCVGELFSWTEAVLALATLARHWAPRLRPGWTVDEEPLITLRPRGGLPMILEVRGDR